MHQFPVTVYYDETDLGAIVYHANYMKFIDRARADWVRGLGVDQNGDGKVENPEVPGTLIPESIAIWSAGPDGDFDTWADNVKTW